VAENPNITSTSAAVKPPSDRVTWNMATIAATSIAGMSALVTRSSANEARYEACARTWAPRSRR
jgi:hypothetical protein